MKAKHAFALYLVFRLIISFNVRTFFQPDEYYQALEPAHHAAFGYGYLTWEWQEGIRSISHALLYAVPYKILGLLRLDTPGTINAVPKVVGAIQAAAADYYTVAFSRKYWPTTGKWAVVVTVFSAWNAFAMTRSFSNSLETALTAYALYKWPFDKTQLLKTDEMFYDYIETTIKSLSAIGFAFVVRPTTVLLWFLPALRQLQQYKTTFLFEAVFVAYVAVQYAVILDSFYYGSITLSMWKFFKFNSTGSADFYGVSNWHYYLVQGLPLLLTGYLPFFLHGVYRASTVHRPFLYMASFVVAVYSVLGHKEVRFIMPLLPILHGFTASSLSSFTKRKSFIRSCTVVVMLLLNVGIAFYGTQIHQRGVMDLIQHVSQDSSISELTLFMPCHSTPWLAQIHRPVSHFRFLTCEPPLHLSQTEKRTYRDEADQFYDDPAAFLHQDLAVNGAAEHVAIFEASQPVMERFWTTHDLTYVQTQKWFNSHLHDDARRRGDVILYKRVTQS